MGRKWRCIMNQVRIELPGKKIEEFCKRNHIQRFSVFGSVLRDDFRPDSDTLVIGQDVFSFLIHFKNSYSLGKLRPQTFFISPSKSLEKAS
jgi:predicted nucleotidyltransferase